MGSVESYDVLVLSVDEPESLLIPVLTSDAGECNAVLSSDGRWVTPVSEPPWQISTDGGVDPCFAVDGSEVYFVGPDEWLYAARVIPGDDFRTEDPTSLF